ncbi:hypothetical protein BZA77DRAFT_320364 [Pyronema omphalodes]|nr:hypothetical protein BZA77DRAFT_320364 [Pyronema omphalodes]
MDKNDNILGREGEKTKKKKDYVFRDIWDGRCEFKEDGLKYIQCKYYPPLPSGTSTPTSPIQESPPPPPLYGSTTTISATSPLHNTSFSSSSFSSSHPRKSKSIPLSVLEWKHNPSHRRGISISNAAKDERYSKAKLGMLIVHGPGQDMLDLVVAANLGRVWRTLVGRRE